MKPKIGFVGMTHLGLISGVSAAEKDFIVLCFDPNEEKIKLLKQGIMPVSEPDLERLVQKNNKRLDFSSNKSDLSSCDVIYVAPDVPTNDKGESDLTSINELLELTLENSNEQSVIVLLSQVPPGFTRTKVRRGRHIYYQVETLIFGRAIERALYPERYIIGCEDPAQPLPAAFDKFLAAHECPILPMRYESAELTKISINMFLVASVSTSNTIAELCEKIKADWSEIAPALRLDKRIGKHAYLTAGLGIAGGNLERDLATICQMAERHSTDAGVVKAWIENSHHRKSWPVKTLKSAQSYKKDAVVAIWGLAYKENTHSTKNSPALVALSQLREHRLRVYDPIVQFDPVWHSNTSVCTSAHEALSGADALLLMTPWPEFREARNQKIISESRPSIIIDPYNLTSNDFAAEEYFTLGRAE